jgi:hypothetical protein
MILTTMTTATTMAVERVDFDQDDKKDPNGKDNDNLIFDTTTNLWADAFLAGRVVVSNGDDNGNNDGRGEGLLMTTTATTTTTTTMARTTTMTTKGCVIFTW